MKINLSHHRATQGINIATRCPHCGHFGTFEELAIGDIEVVSKTSKITNYYMGIRRCPNENCKGHLFYIKNYNGELIFTSPSESIPFDRENIPTSVLAAFDEAIRCHSNSCFIASAIMIRKTLEELCHERNATGKYLKDRISNLGTVILIPKELLEGMDELRLLGNDAAHIEANTFSEIGKEEIEISIDFTKEILKAVYQYESLLNKLKSLKEKKII